MTNTLHIQRKAGDTKALECIQAQDKACDVSLLLIQDGLKVTPPDNLKCYTLKDMKNEPSAPGDEDSIEYDRFVQLLFEHDSIIVW